MVQAVAASKRNFDHVFRRRKLDSHCRRAIEHGGAVFASAQVLFQCWRAELDQPRAPRVIRNLAATLLRSGLPWLGPLCKRHLLAPVWHQVPEKAGRATSSRPESRFFPDAVEIPSVWLSLQCQGAAVAQPNTSRYCAPSELMHPPRLFPGLSFRSVFARRDFNASQLIPRV